MVQLDDPERHGRAAVTYMMHQKDADVYLNALPDRGCGWNAAATDEGNRGGGKRAGQNG